MRNDWRKEIKRCWYKKTKFSMNMWDTKTVWVFEKMAFSKWNRVFETMAIIISNFENVQFVCWPSKTETYK